MNILFAQQNPAPLRLKTGLIRPSGYLTPVQASQPASLRPFRHKDHYYVLLQFKSIPDQAEKEILRSKGIALYDYLPDHAYLAELADSSTIRSMTGVYGVPAAQKLSSALLNSGQYDQPIGISFFGSLSAAEVTRELQQAGAVIFPTKIHPTHTIFVRANGQTLQKIAALPYISFIAPQSLKDQSLNYNNRAYHGIDALANPGGRNLQGDGVTVGVGDNGDPYAHVDFTGRQISRFADAIGAHGIHTSGTVAGGGIIDPKNRGMAPHATIVSQYYSDILVNAPTYIQDYNMVLTNNSYTAYDPGCASEGEYDFLSNYMDAMAITYPYLLNDFAAGNDGALTCAPFVSPYATIKSGYQSAKNVLTIGNMWTTTNSISTTSSCGPVDDGRIKPEIVAGGTGILSTWPNNSYAYQSGTSMSSPTVTGSLALLVQRYRQLHGGADPASALIKALACNTANDLGRAGPDFLYGFGSLNIRAAVEAMENNRYYTGTISNGGAKTFTITGIPAGVQQLKVMLYWPDVPGAPFAATALVNNLDLTVTGSDGVKHLPLILNPAVGHTTDLAVEGVDNINNIEQVVISHPPAGNVDITITGSDIPSGPQDFVVAYQLLQPGVTLEYPFGNETWVPGESEVIRWTAAGGEPNTFNLEFSADNGSTWSPVNSSPITTDLRQYTWTVPAVATSQALIRVTRNVAGYSDVSDYNFTILGQPVLTATNPCQGYAQLSWPAIPSATSYDIMQLKGDSMQKIMSTAGTSVLIPGLRRDSSYWLAVRAVNGGIPGRRSLASMITPSGGSCALTALDNDLTVDSLVMTNTTGRLHTSTELSNSQPVKIELKNLGTIPASTAFTVSYRINGGPVISEPVSVVIAPNSAYIHAFTAKADFSAAASYQLDTWIDYPGDPQPINDTLHILIRQLANDPLTLDPVFTEGFESAAPSSYIKKTTGLTGLDRFDFSSSNANGRVRTFINSGFARTGVQCATLDQQHYNPVQTTDSLIMTFNLSNYTSADQLWLNFWYRNQGIDSSWPGNQVWIRGNDQAAWIPVHALNYDYSNIGVYLASPNIDIRSILAAATPAQTISSSTQIKFGEQGNTSANSVITDGSLDDGYSFDDITLTHAVNDAGILSLAAPVTTNICNLSASETISVKVRNYSAGVMSNIPVSYSINGTTVTETIPSISPFDSVTYSFTHKADLSAYKKYTLKAWVSSSGDTYSFNDSLLPVDFQTAPLIASFPYLESFETNNGYWYTGGSNSSWEWGTPAKKTIHKAASGTKGWFTHLAGNYNDNELSYLYSPCFDLSALPNPVLSFSHIFQMEDGCACDYHWVEYSIDGANWYKLGFIGGGTTWYDNAARQAWQMSDTSWHVSSYDLPTNASKVRLRIVMFSDPGTDFEGVGIDDIHIFDKAAVYTGPNISSGLERPVNGNGWTHFDQAGHRVASINPNGQDLGQTRVQAYIHSGPVRNDSVQYYLDRNIVIKPATAASKPVRVRYYFTYAEAQKLISATGCPGCTTIRDAYSAGVTQYSSPETAEEDSTIVNDLSGEFHFFEPRKDLSIVPYDNGYYAEYQVEGFSEFWINNGGPGNDLPLPVSLLSFTAMRQGPAALLQFNVPLSAHARKFVIERARQEDQFQALDSLDAHTGNDYHYEYIDHYPGKGITWYRIRMVDPNDRSIYSPVRSISDTAGALVVSIYPNPVHSGLIYINTSAPARSIRLLDISGRVIVQSNSHGYFNTLPVPGLSRGIYVLSIETDAGKTVRKIFVK